MVSFGTLSVFATILRELVNKFFSVNYKLLLQFSTQHPRMFRVWLGREPYVFGYTSKDAEVGLSEV